MTRAMARPTTKATSAAPTWEAKPVSAVDLSVSRDLLAWYDRHSRTLPWRAAPGEHADPYRVWLSEIMLQQTTVAAVKPYFKAFLARWPDVAALAAAPLDAVLSAWAGLGYYSRARNLHACARHIVEVFGGQFPNTEVGLRTLPGVGPYTAAAIAAIAFDRRAVVVDGNVERVMARLFAIGAPLPQARPALRAAMDAVTPDRRCGDFAQATMDLGATICTPRSPACVICPLQPRCRAASEGRPVDFPRKQPKKPTPTRHGAVFFVRREDGHILLRRRPVQGLFGGMSELPGTPWLETFDTEAELMLPDYLLGPLRPLGTVEHGLTHFRLLLDVYAATTSETLPDTYRWANPNDLADEGLPTLMRKVVDLGLRATS